MSNITRAQYLQQFKQITDEMYDLTSRKNNDYGGESDPWKNFRDFGELGILVRMSDKFARIKTALHEKRAFQVADETVEDTIKDLATYSIILLLWRRAHAPQQKVEPLLAGQAQSSLGLHGSHYLVGPAKCSESLPDASGYSGECTSQGDKEGPHDGLILGTFF